MTVEVTKDQVIKFLHSNYLMTLSTIRDGNIPQSAVMLYYMDDEMNFYFVTRANSRKVASLEANNNVSMVVWEEGKEYVQLEATAMRIVDEQEEDEAMENLANTMTSIDGFWSPMYNVSGAEYAVYKLTPNWFRYQGIASSNISNYEAPVLEMNL